MDEIRIIPYSRYEAHVNMAADEYIMSLPGTILRFYGWSTPSLSFGRFRNKLSEIDESFCRRNNISLVKRLTGGQTVLHQHELTYSIASDINLFSDSITKTYKMISQPLVEALKSFGVPAAMEKQKRSRSNSNICFKEVSSFEIAVGNKKLVGSAQFRSSKRFLQHGSILMNIDWNLWKKTWRIPSNSSELETRITHIANETTRQVDLIDLADTISQKLAVSLNKSCSENRFSAKDWTGINNLAGKYKWELS